MKIIAHRSGPVLYPEQTVASAKLALEKGADFVEIDVQFTSDRKIAVCHDPDALRHFGVDKKICDMTEIEFLSLRHLENRAYPSHLFEDFLMCGVKPLIIHTKRDDIVDELLSVIDKHNYADNVIIGVVRSEDAKKVKAKNKNIGVLGFIPNTDIIEEFALAGADFIRLWEKHLTDENISRVAKTGKKLWVMTDSISVGMTTRERLEKILALSPDGILVNDVTELIAMTR